MVGWRRWAALFSVVAIVVGACTQGTAPPTGGSPGASATPSASGSATPSATASGQPSPSGAPGSPGPLPDPADVAGAVVAATSDEERTAAILDVLRAVAIGVYTADGAPIVHGAERTAVDFFLYDFEVTTMAVAQGRGDTYGPEDVAALLEEVGIDNDGQPITAEELAAAIRQATVESVAEPSDSLAFVPLLVRELGLRAAEPYDLATEVPLEQIRLGAVAYFLVVADFLLPIVRAAEPPQTAASNLVASTDGILAFALQVAGVCDSIVGEVGKESWGIGKYLSTGLSAGAGAFAKMATAAIDILHGMLLAFSVKVFQQGDVYPETHYGHDGPGTELRFELTVEMLDDYTKPPWSFNEAHGQMIMKCGWLLGIEWPKQGPIKGVRIHWLTGSLEEHGQVICPEVGCRFTGEDGLARLRFIPKVEPPPAGWGEEESDDPAVLAIAAYLSRHKNYLGTPAQYVTPKYALWGPRISWHQAVELSLEIDSTIGGVKTLLGTAVAKGTIPLKWVQTGSQLFDGHFEGEGEVTYTTTPGKLVNCGEVVVAGSGVTQGKVAEATIDRTGLFDTKLLFGVAASAEIYTLPGCHTGIYNIPPRDSLSSFWTPFLFVSHRDDFDVIKGGFWVEDWVYVADETTFKNGGLLARRTYLGNCKGECEETTRFLLWVKPVK